jgi:FtsH-binding integral membrane protein
MTDEESPARLRRFLTGVVGMAAVPIVLLGIAAAGFGYILWVFVLGVVIFFQGLYPAGGIGVWPSITIWFAYTVFSCFAAVRIMQRFPDISTSGSGAFGLIICWGWLLLTGTLVIAGWLLSLYPPL